MSHNTFAASNDGIIAFMMNFAASNRNKDVAPATGDFIKASPPLFRKQQSQIPSASTL